MSRKATKKTADLVAKMDGEAESLLSADKKDLSLETRVTIFSQVAKWVQIRNRLGDSEENEGLLDAYRTTLDAAQGALVEREAERIKTANDPARRFLGRKQRAAKGGTADNGGAELEALKARLPRTDDGGDDGDRGRGGGEGLAIAGAGRLVRAELPGHGDTGLDESYSSDDF